jgi:hypothetical protein
MLTRTAVAIFPIALVSYVIVRDEIRNVTRSIDFETRDAAQIAQARFSRLLDQRQLHAVAGPRRRGCRGRSAAMTRRASRGSPGATGS